MSAANATPQGRVGKVAWRVPLHCYPAGWHTAHCLGHSRKGWDGTCSGTAPSITLLCMNSPRARPPPSTATLLPSSSPQHSQAPNYSKTIPHPMCFDVMRERIAHAFYPTLREFEQDLFLVFQNAMAYNPPEHWIHAHAQCLAEVASKYLEQVHQGNLHFRCEGCGRV